ncbi:WD40-repeat-containing domain [Trinorchestia longiramus]|nr:WD40-repeat-containing domain [Trinorchestia longiramus]
MFSSHLNNAVGFASNWKTNQQRTFSSTQTDDVRTQESECQVLLTENAAAQTDDVEPPASGSATVDESSLLQFLNKITPLVLEELDKQNRSVAFDGFDGLDDEDDRGAAVLHTLRWPQLFAQGVVTGLSWNATGSVLAVAYGAQTHDTWCKHRSIVALCNLNRCENVSISPERELDVQCCVPAVAFHPFNPAILAVATTTGEVLVYDLSDSESVTAIMTSYTGGSGVTCLVWYGSGMSALAAATQGGHVLCWTVSITKQALTLEHAFIITEEDLPRSHRASVNSLSEGGVGITSLSFNSEDPSVFVAAVEGGSLLLCTTTKQLPSAVTVEGVQCRRCVVTQLSGHNGRTLIVQCSPYLRNALISLGSDDQLKLHSLLQPHQPIATLYSDTAISVAQWSSARALLVAVSLPSGQVNFLDVCGLQQADQAVAGLSSGTAGTPGADKPLLSLPPPDKTAPVTAIQFNRANGSLLAVGDSLGRVWVWRLPSNVVSPQTTDFPRLKALLERATDL